jgi:hypothetical protein
MPHEGILSDEGILPARMPSPITRARRVAVKIKMCMPARAITILCTGIVSIVALVLLMGPSLDKLYEVVRLSETFLSFSKPLLQI